MWEIVYSVSNNAMWLAYIDAIKAQRAMARLWDEVSRAFPIA